MMSQEIHKTINLQNQVGDEPSKTHIIDINGYMESTSECEKINDVDVNLECDEDEGNGTSIIGKLFNTPHDAYVFYNQHALLHGFGIRIHQDYKNKTTNETYRKMYVCNKQGFKRLKSNSSCVNLKKCRRDVRTGCQAMLRISKGKDGKWIVDNFNDTHNHELTITPTKVMEHCSHGKFNHSIPCKSLMAERDRSELEPSQIKSVVKVIRSPYEADVTSKQCVDVLFEQQKEYRLKELYGLIKHFQDKALTDINQYFAMDLYKDKSPKNVFWADEKSRDAYTKFGDVVVFDVMYMSNNFKIPFATFIGVNHHGQSILFGCALLGNENEETFEWLFEQFAKCMFSKFPKAIIIDQDKSMVNAINKVFPNTRHRYCAWHIKKRELEHIGPLVTRYSDFQEAYRQWVKSDTIEEFETKWEIIRGRYNLERNSWINEMYNQRRHWAKAFLKDVFFAGMTKNERSKSIHSFFDGFVDSNTMLNEFVIQFDKAVDSRRGDEEDEDFKTISSKPILSSVHPIEAKAGEYYTRTIFEVFKKEWVEATSNLTHETLSKSSKEIKYRVGKLNVDKTHWRFVSFYFQSQVNVTCSCARFETYGILCKHSLYVMKKRHVETLPNYYILPRWTLDAKFKVGNGSNGFEEINKENEVSALTLWCVRANFTKAMTHARESPSEINNLNNLIVKYLKDQMVRKKSNAPELASEGSCLGISQADMIPQLIINDPRVLTSMKGGPNNASKINSCLEVKKKRRCSYCNGLGHYVSSCLRKKEDDSLEEE